MKFARLAVHSFLLAGLFTASAQVVPEPTDTALRTRVNQFYTYELNHQFRQAEQLVAEDSKDFFYNMKKPELSTFTFDKIEYGPDFKSAKVYVRVSGPVLMPGAGPITMPSMAVTWWRVEDGQWVWYLNKDSLGMTPLGKMGVGPNVGKPGAVPPPPIAPSNGRAFAPFIGAKGLQLEPPKISLSGSKPQPVTVKATSHYPGPVGLVAKPIAGINVTLGASQIEPNKTIDITIRPEPDSPERPATINITVMPMSLNIPIQVAWTP